MENLTEQVIFAAVLIIYIPRININKIRQLHEILRVIQTNLLLVFDGF